MAVTTPLTAFEQQPYGTLLALAWPVFIALSLEPMAGAIDTVFLARRGAPQEAALGVAVMVMTSAFWVFNFLGVGTQSAVAQALGRDDASDAGGRARQAITVALLLGTLAGLALFWSAPAVVGFMEATGETATEAVTYLRIRALGGPALLVMLATFGALRGSGDMRTPMFLAGLASALNIALDMLLIEGAGPLPELGVAGAAWATLLGHVVAAGAAVWTVRRRFPLATDRPPPPLRELVKVGTDMFLRSSALMAFLLLCTREATAAGDAAGAAHQMVRQVWILLAFMLDSFASSAQTLVGGFVGRKDLARARRVAKLAVTLCVALSAGLAVLFLVGKATIARHLLAREVAEELWTPAYGLMLVGLPLNAIAFATDGVHMGAGAFAYLRKGMLLSTLVALSWLLGRPVAMEPLTHIWVATTLWIVVRSLWGLVGVWPGAAQAWRG
jgi:MATE family multidrug resistance protein